MKHTGGNWNPDDRGVYFLATIPGEAWLRVGSAHGWMLLATNDLFNDSGVDLLGRACDGANVLLDSGIFWLTNEHKRAHGVTMDEALALAPDEVDGFDRLFDRYVELVEQFGDRLWGYIELDQGGRENKRKTRARLEAMGLRPIPVYHPLNDGADYLEELMSSYDRICFGNIVQANAPTRRRLLHMMWEAHTRHPDVWIHVLGLTPDQTLLALPSDSADSSTWCASVRWHTAHRDKVCMTSFSAFPRDDAYLRSEGSHTDHVQGWDRAISKAGTLSTGTMGNWRSAWAERQALGFHLYDREVL